MTESNNTLPDLQSAENLAMDEIRPYLLDAREDYPETFYMLEYQGVPFSAIGGIQALSGQKKNGKTFVIAQLMAACLAPDSPRVHDNLPGLTVPQRTLDHLGHLPNVLWIDTEMEKLNSAKVLRRVHWLIGQDMKIPHPRFNAMWMRTVEATETEQAYRKRWRIIKTAIDVLKPDIVFIDGIRDIIGDFNNNEESASLVQELMAIAEKQGICIWNVLHMNPRPGNDDESKMRGHLGTELGNKVTDTLVSIKNKAKDGKVTFTVKQIDARGKDLEDWQFEVTEQAGSLGVPRIIAGGAVSTKKEVEPDSLRDIISWIQTARASYEWPMSQNDIRAKVFAEIGGQKNSDKQKADMKLAIANGLLQESTIKKNGYPMLLPADDLPF
jgi:hypothetical protein